MKSVSHCIRFFGTLFVHHDDVCSNFVQKENFVDLLKKVFTYCQKKDRKDAFWVISNIAVNSEQDAIILAQCTHVILSILIACKDNAFEMRKEGAWALSNIVYKLPNSGEGAKVL